MEPGVRVDDPLLCPGLRIKTNPGQTPKMLPRELWAPEFSKLPGVGAAWPGRGPRGGGVVVGPEDKWGPPHNRNNQGKQSLEMMGKAQPGWEQASKAQLCGCQGG